MRTLIKQTNLLLIILLIAGCSPIDQEKYLEEGVSKLLATYRNATIDDVSYELALDIPEGKDEPVTGRVTIGFILNSKREPLVIDFRVPDDHLRSISVNGKSIEPVLRNGHIIIPEKDLAKSFNSVDISFRAGDMSLNRNNDYLYTLFVPDRASTAFPCFDQPDIKARFRLTLETPHSYRAMSNSPATGTDTTENGVITHFAETKPISTYLFAFVAGKFEIIEKNISGTKMSMFHRETRRGYIENNAGEIFRLHLCSLKWLEEYTHIAYPFDKFGFVLLPSFQYSGMEHPGVLYYKASSLLLDESPTLKQKLDRATLIAHETSHIWFGDLVTMKWFDDVWLKEVFAGYMSDKIVYPDYPGINHDLRFFLSRYPAAYAVDRTRGTNPIIQELDNMKNAGSLYGAIIYNKAPVVMRHLEKLTGEDNLREGLNLYLKKYSWGSAQWDDLIRIIEETTHQPLEEWSRMWVREAGMPVIEPLIRKQEQYAVSFTEKDPAGMVRHWPQTLSTMVITDNDTVTGELRPADAKSVLYMPAKPQCIIPDISATAYGTFLFDSLTIDYLKAHLHEFADPILRGVILVNLYENLVNGKISPADYYKTIYRAIDIEPDLQLRNYLAGRFSSAFWHHLSEAERTAAAPDAEKMVWMKIMKAPDMSDQRLWFNLYRDIAVTAEGTDRLSMIWKRGQLPGGLVLSEDDLCTLALSLALRGHKDAERIIMQQRERITDTDRLMRFNFVVPSVSSDQDVRDELFNTLRNPANREHEPWVIDALGYLHHPMVAQRSIHYILASLEMLEEIKSTGDIFFPGSWISTTLAGHHSAEAKEIVEGFLEEHPDFPPDLRLKVLQAADHLFRAYK